MPTPSAVIVANSPQDVALQEEIRKIRAYNAYVDSQVGVSETIEVFEPASQTATHAYSNGRIELFETPITSTQVTYAAPQQQAIQTTPAATGFRTIETTNTAYRVTQGDTLYGLARANCISVSDIQNANNMSDSGLRLGQNIAMPASRCEVIAARSQTTVTTKDSFVRKVMPVPTSINVGSPNNYAVLPKDTLYSIGRRYCISATEVATHNGIGTAKAIQPGQILSIPDTACLK